MIPGVPRILVFGEFNVCSLKFRACDIMIEMDLSKFLPQIPALYLNIIMIVLFVWSFFWKGLALWHSSKNNQRIWFVAILLLNTVGILEIIYLFYFSTKRLKLADIKALLSQVRLK